MVEVKGEPVRVDEALAPLVEQLEAVLAASGASEMRQTAAVLTLCRGRFVALQGAIAGAPPEVAQMLTLMEFWLRLHRQIIAQENLRVRVPLGEFAAEKLPGEE